MRKSKFSEEQIIGILKEAEAGVEIATLLRRHGISRATLYKWRSQYAGATVNELKRIKELEADRCLRCRGTGGRRTPMSDVVLDASGS